MKSPFSHTIGSVLLAMSVQSVQAQSGHSHPWIELNSSWDSVWWSDGVSGSDRWLCAEGAVAYSALDSLGNGIVDSISFIPNFFTVEQFSNRTELQFDSLGFDAVFFRYRSTSVSGFEPQQALNQSGVVKLNVLPGSYEFQLSGKKNGLWTPWSCSYSFEVDCSFILPKIQMVKDHDELGNSRIRIKVPGLDSNEYRIQWSNGDTAPVASLNAGWHWCDVVVNNYCTLRDSFFIEWQCDEPVLLESPSDRDENYFASLCGFWKTEREECYIDNRDRTCLIPSLSTVIFRPIDSVYTIQWSTINAVDWFQIQLQTTLFDTIITIPGNRSKYRFDSFGNLLDGKTRIREIFYDTVSGSLDTLSWSCWQKLTFSFPFDYSFPTLASVNISCNQVANRHYPKQTRFIIRMIQDNCGSNCFGPWYSVLDGKGSGSSLCVKRKDMPYKYYPLIACAPNFACRSGCIQYDLEKGDFELFNNEVSGFYSGARSEGELDEVLPATKNFRCSLFPNPASDYLVLQASETMKYSIFSTNGTVLTQGRLEAGEIRLNLEGMAKGFYVFLAFNEEGESQRIFFQIR